MYKRQTLTIISSATVSPSRSDFKLVAYGLSEVIFEPDITSYDIYTSSTISKPYVSGGTASDAVISSTIGDDNNNKIIISDITANWSEPGQRVLYYFMIKNEGQYDAYFLREELDNYWNKMLESTICTAGDGTNQDMVDIACGEIELLIRMISSTDGEMLPLVGPEYFKLDKYESSSNFGYLILEITLNYSNDSDGARADGDFIVDFPDISLEFTSVPPTS